MKFSILSTGRMAQKMARTTISKMEGIEPYAVASRSIEKARAFAESFGFKKAYGSYEELVADPLVELVYIATPHPFHYENARLCLEAGKPVLVEKAFTMNAHEAGELIALSHKKGVLLAEAVWTRYMPSRKILTDLLAEGTIGRVIALTANLGYPLTHKKRVTDPALGGGALLDVGVYPLNFALMAVDGGVKEVYSSAVFSPEGVDWMNFINLTFENGITASLHSSMITLLDSEGTIYGEKGFLKIQNINNCEEIRCYDNQFHLLRTVSIPPQISGYEYEVEACARALAKGEIQCPQMPHSESLRVSRLLDLIRDQWKHGSPASEK